MVILPPSLHRRPILQSTLELIAFEAELDRKGLEEKEKNPPCKSDYRIIEILFRGIEPPTPQP